MCVVTNVLCAAVGSRGTNFCATERVAHVLALAHAALEVSHA